MTSSEVRNKRRSAFAYIALAAAIFCLLTIMPEFRRIICERTFYTALIFTLIRASAAFFAAFAAALFAALCSQNAVFASCISPIVTVMRSLPTMAVVLLLIVNCSANATTVLVGVIVLFPSFYAALLPAATGVDRQLLDVAAVYGANKLQKLVFVTLPSMAPAILENAIAGLSFSLKLIVSSEVLAQTAKSLGMMMQSARAYLQTDRLAALTAFVAALCILTDGAGKLVSAKIRED